MTSDFRPLVTVLINNYNYGHFLAAAIDSALAQTYRPIEVVVVDDGSTDRSGELIASYGERIVAVLKPNGGQASAINAAVNRSSGSVVYLLDSDDLLHSTAVQRTIGFFEDDAVAKAHWPVEEIDEQGRSLSAPRRPRLPEGDLRDVVCRDGPGSHAWPPTSANAFSRDALETLLPIPEPDFRIAADTYLCQLAPFLGVIRRSEDRLTQYRKHGSVYHSRSVEDRVSQLAAMAGPIADVASRLCGSRADADRKARWVDHSWPHRVLASLSDIDCVIGDRAFLLLDDDEWGLRPDERRHPMPFPGRDGVYWGPPTDDAAAIAEFEGARQRGAEYAVVAWPARSWLDHYPRFASTLRQSPVALANDRIVIHDLRKSRAEQPHDLAGARPMTNASDATALPLVSIVISSYNYAPYLRASIDSALAQTWPRTEVIVVDDGSTDESPQIIATYHERVASILGPNRGQGHAWTVGFAASAGDVVIFLDSDDVLLPEAAARAAAALADPDVVHVHWLLREVDAASTPTGRTWPSYPIWRRPTRLGLLRRGHDQLGTVPSSGNAWSRAYLERVMPVPEQDYRTCPDDYLTLLAPLFGSVRHLDAALTLYRFHGRNQINAHRLDEKLRLYHLRTRILLAWADALGATVDPQLWDTTYRDWLEAGTQAATTVRALAAPGERVILIDQDELRAEIGDPRLVPFLERDGGYWGPPSDDDEAIRELDRLRSAGVVGVVIARPARWWLDHYTGFADHLRGHRVVRDDEMVVAFDLRQPGEQPAHAPVERRGPVPRAARAAGGAVGARAGSREVGRPRRGPDRPAGQHDRPPPPSSRGRNRVHRRSRAIPPGTDARTDRPRARDRAQRRDPQDPRPQPRESDLHDAEGRLRAARLARELGGRVAALRLRLCVLAPVAPTRAGGAAGLRRGGAVLLLGLSVAVHLRRRGRLRVAVVHPERAHGRQSGAAPGGSRDRDGLARCLHEPGPAARRRRDPDA